MSTIEEDLANNSNGIQLQSLVVDKLLDDPQMQELVVMEYEKLSPMQMFKQFRSKAREQGHCLIPHWLALLLANLLLVSIFGLLTAAIMLAQNPPGKSNAVTAEPLKSTLPYQTECFTWDNSCDLAKKLWCVNGRCLCYDQLAFWNGSSCVFCPNGSFYDGTACSCPSYSFPDLTSTNTCRSYSNLSQSCVSPLRCNPRSNLICNSTTCLCASGYYWNSTNPNDPQGYCVPYSSHTERCNGTSQCVQNVSLTCQNGTCRCPTTGTWFWTGTTCTQIQTFNGTCIYDSQCDGTLQLICNNSRCICAGATPYGTWFWNGTQCVLCPLGWLNYQIYCYYNSQAAATWNNSRAYCQRFGADLLVIRDQAEFNFIKPQAAAIIGNRRRAFIGYYTLSTVSPGQFAWLDSSLPTFTGNHANQPWWCGPQPTFSFSTSYTPNVQGCGALQLESNGDICMNDWWYSELLPFICKKSQ